MRTARRHRAKDDSNDPVANDPGVCTIVESPRIAEPPSSRPVICAFEEADQRRAVHQTDARQPRYFLSNLIHLNQTCHI